MAAPFSPDTHHNTQSVQGFPLVAPTVGLIEVPCPCFNNREFGVGMLIFVSRGYGLVKFITVAVCYYCIYMHPQDAGSKRARWEIKNKPLKKCPMVS